MKLREYSIQQLTTKGNLSERHLEYKLTRKLCAKE